jgi:type II secretory pathway component PulC
MRALLSTLCVAVLLVGCGGSPGPSSETVENEAPPPDPATVPPSEPPASEGTIDRAELDAVLAGGLGRFLQRVETEPHLEEGRFVGFRLTELRSEVFEDVDLQPGDTLVSVNGMPIERPEEAMQVWNGLRVASELTVEYLREGERHQLRFAISD